MESSLDYETTSGGRMKFVFGGVLILAAVVYLIISSTAQSSQFYVTVDELVTNQQAISTRDVRVSGAVVGESIEYDPQTLTLRFLVASVPGNLDQIEKEGGLAKVLHEAVTDPSRNRMQVEYIGPKPDLLQHEAQAIMTGRIGDDGIFYAEELLLKCPTRYEEYNANPEQLGG